MLAALPERELVNDGGRYLDKLSALSHTRTMMLLDDWKAKYNSTGLRFILPSSLDRWTIRTLFLCCSKRLRRLN